MKKKRTKKKSDLFGHKFMIGFGVVLVLVLSGIFYAGIHAKPADQSNPTAGSIPIYFQSAKDAMPFPATLEPAAFKRADVREAYQVAKDIPEVLVQQPCYCYCRRKGHRGLLDCFKTDHAASCNICVKEALLAGGSYALSLTAVARPPYYPYDGGGLWWAAPSLCCRGGP